jgi:hypothetical protein
MSHRRSKKTRKKMRELGIEITSILGRKRYQHAKRIRRFL